MEGNAAATVADTNRLRARARAAVNPWWPLLAAYAVIEFVAAPLEAVRVTDDLLTVALVLSGWFLAPRVVAWARTDDDRYRGIVPDRSRYGQVTLLFLIGASGCGLAFLLDAAAPHHLVAPIGCAVMGLLTWALLGWRERSIALLAFAVALAGENLAEPFIHPALRDTLVGVTCVLVAVLLRAAERRALDVAL